MQCHWTNLLVIVGTICKNNSASHDYELICGGYSEYEIKEWWKEKPMVK